MRYENNFLEYTTQTKKSGSYESDFFMLKPLGLILIISYSNYLLEILFYLESVCLKLSLCQL